MGKCFVCGHELPEPIAEKLGTPIGELGLSRGAEKCLYRGQIEYIEQLLQKDTNDLARIRGLGAVTLAEILCKVQKFGFSIRRARRK